MEEEWRPAPGIGGTYSVSDLGRIRRETRGHGTWPGRILKPKCSKRLPYERVSPSVDDVVSDWYVHRLVCWAFHGPPPFPEAEANHKNGIKTDNRSDNLEWQTHSGNHLHRHHVLGKRIPIRRGAATGTSKLTDSQVLEIRALAGKLPQAVIGERYGIRQATVSGIILRKSWRHI